jgi:hypothetical protein
MVPNVTQNHVCAPAGNREDRVGTRTSLSFVAEFRPGCEVITDFRPGGSGMRRHRQNRDAAIVRARGKQNLSNSRVGLGLSTFSKKSSDAMSDPDPMQEAKNERADPRTTVRRCGWLSRTKGEQLRECVVMDESRKGARLAVDAPNEIPDDFYIYMSLESTSRHHCRVAWRSDKQIGVEFLD